MRGWLLGLLLVAAAAPACETDHGALAKSRNTGGAAGAAGRASGGNAQAGFTMIPQTGGTQATGTGGRAPDEPPGKNMLTFVHGVVDAGRVLLCFVAGRGDSARALGAPVAELDYGQSLVLPAIDGASFASDDIEPVIIAGELDWVAELDCAEAIAIARAEQDAAPTSAEPPIDTVGGGAGAGGAPSSGGGAADGGAPVNGGAGGAGGDGSPPLPEPPRLRLGELPILPAGTLNGGRSYLFVANGCIGGPAFAGKDARAACGERYSPGAPTLSAVLVAMSRRVEFGKLGLQVAHASVATAGVDVSSSRVLSEPGSALVIASGVEFGTLLPGIARTTASSEEYLANSAFGQVDVLEVTGETFSERWSALTERAGLAALDDGTSYALVVLGPNPGLKRSGFWNPPALTLVPTDPSRDDPTQ